LDPYWWDAHVSAARLSRDLGESARAVGWYERAIEIDPIAPEIKVELAEIVLLQGDAHHSVELLAQALELRPGQADWWLLLAEALEADGQLDRADEARCTALSLNPTLENVACETEG
jgi:predicted Zn-dependent protease